VKHIFAIALVGAALCIGQAGLEVSDVSTKAGLTAKTVFGGETSKRYILETTGGGAAFVDYDNDGLLDVFIVNGSALGGSGQPAPASYLYRNKGDGTFEDVTRRARLTKSGWGQGVCAGDYDNDGYVDLFVTYWGQNVLYRNLGNGTFTAARLPAQRQRWGSGCAFLDYDRDGRLDLFVSNYVDFDLETATPPGANPFCQFRGLSVICGPRGLKGESNILYHNNGDGSFTDVSERAGIATVKGNFSLGVLTGDFDNDGWPDVYVANDTNASLLFHNKHDGTFEEIGVLAGCAYNSDGKETSGMGVAAADYDGDGWLDIFKTNFSDEAASLYRNSGQGMFVDVAQQAGVGKNQMWLGWGCGFLDFDNDGWPDLFLVNGHVYPEVDGAKLGLSYRQPKVLYRNIAGQRFEEVASPVLNTPSASRGCAFGDYDNDGQVEIAINNMGEAPSLLRLKAAGGNHWIRLRLRGTVSNRSAIGARVTCVTGKHRQMDEVRSGGSYLSQNDLRLHFGLGSAARVDLLEIRWPNGAVERHTNLPVDRQIDLTEGAPLRRGKF
jgi:enediyne biosynthesis protein E4